jgi:hypothetical protein
VRAPPPLLPPWGRQAWLVASQKLAAGQSVSCAQTAAQTPAEQMAERHWLAAAQLSPSGWPQRPSAAQRLAAHWLAAVHWAPAGERAAQVPALQKLAARHSESLAQEVPQVPLLQAPARHWVGALQAPPVSVPQRPSAAQVPEAQAAGRVQVPPTSALGAQVPAPVHQASAAHWASAVQALAHWPLTQAPPRQTAPVTHWPPLGVPHCPSAPQTPEVHCTPEVQGCVGGEPLGAEGRQAWLVASQ